MKKIGILTLPLIKNYGGILQAFALQKFLQDLGHEVTIIDRQFDEDWFSPAKSVVKKLFFPDKHKSEQELEEIARNPKNFIRKYLVPKTKKITSEKELENIVNSLDLDIIITGSDQVWRLDYANTLRNNMFLNFVDKTKTKKLSYAASFGKEDWNHSDTITQELKGFLNDFEQISVREDSAVDICKEKFGLEANQHVDPTMLLKKEAYEELVVAENEAHREGNILVYMLDITTDRQRSIDKISRALQGKYFLINAKSHKDEAALEDRKYPTVTSWLRGFMDADFAIVDSFHGCVFSILFNIPFIAYGNKKRGLTRFTSLLTCFGLEDRLILREKEITEELIHAKINWAKVNLILDEKRKNSEIFLKTFI